MFDQTLTLADVCSAIAEGRLAVTSDGRAYEVSALELRRYFNERRSFPPLTYVQVLSANSLETGVSSLPGFCSSGR